MNRTRSLVLTAGVATLALAAAWAAATWHFAPCLAQLEHAGRGQLLDGAEQRVASALSHRLKDLAQTTEDWSAWDSIYRFAGNPADDAFREENFGADGVGTLGLSRVMLLALDGSVIVKQDYDVEAGQAVDYPIAQPLPSYLRGLAPDTFREGYAIGPSGHASWFSARPIRDTAKTAPPRGHVVMIRPITQAELSRIASAAGCELTLRSDDPGGGRVVHADPDADADPAQCRAPSTRDHGSVRAVTLTAVDGQVVAELLIQVDLGTLDRLQREVAALFREAAALGALACLALLAFAAAAWWWREPDAAPGGRTGINYAPVVMATATGLILSLAAFQLVHGWHERQVAGEFDRRATNLVEIVSHEIRSSLDFLHYLREYFGSSQHVTREEFDRFVANTAQLRQSITLLAWAPHVEPTHVESPRVYAPEYVIPYEIDGRIRGKDLASEPGFGALMQRACEAGMVVTRATGVWSDEHASGALALVAVYRDDRANDLAEERRENLMGFIVARIDLRRSVARATRRYDAGGVAMAIYDAEKPSPRSELLHYGTIRTSDGARRPARRAYRVIDVAGDRWVAVVTGDDGFSIPGSMGLPRTILIGGLLLTGIAATYLVSMLRRTALVELLVRERTHELYESKAKTQELNAVLLASLSKQRRLTEELTIAKTAADAANQAKSDFLANMSHEIRTPMTAILGFAESLESDALGPVDRAEALRTIRRNGEHLLQIVNDILDVSKIESGRFVLEAVPCCPRELIDEVARLLRPRAEAKGLRFLVQCDGALPPRIRTDPTRLRQILVNLVGNAIKFTSAGEVRIVARDEEAPIAGRRVLRFAVFDTGIGLSRDQIGQLFLPFTQADESTTRRFGGTGLGLTISKRLAQMLGGDLIVESEPGRGSCFIATIEADEVPTGDGPPDCGDAVADPAPAAAWSPLHGRVLLAEDGVDNQRLITFLLRRFGLEVETAVNGRIAVAAALAARDDGEPFDLILMDIQMPEMDGYEATTHLRACGITVPIVALTANAMAGDRERCLAAGCDDFATKPIDRTQLYNLLAAYLDETASERGTAAPVI